jgi:hypothetical protein
VKSSGAPTITIIEGSKIGVYRNNEYTITAMGGEIHSKRVEKGQKYTRNGWKRGKNTLETSGEHAKLHSKRVEKIVSGKTSKCVSAQSTLGYKWTYAASGELISKNEKNQKMETISKKRNFQNLKISKSEKFQNLKKIPKNCLQFFRLAYFLRF